MSKLNSSPKPGRTRVVEAVSARAETAKCRRSRSKGSTTVERGGRRTTINVIARLASVSPGTVSRVLNNRDKIADDTRERVLRATNVLNLTPQASVRFREVAIIAEPNHPDRVEGCAATLTLERGRREPAFFYGDNARGSSFEAMECLHVLTDVMGLKVPQDISLIGGENEGVSTLLNPPLTTIEEPLRDKAEQAALMLDRLTSGGTLAQRHVLLPVRLIERDSVA